MLRLAEILLKKREDGTCTCWVLSPFKGPSPDPAQSILIEQLQFGIPTLRIVKVNSMHSEGIGVVIVRDLRGISLH